MVKRKSSSIANSITPKSSSLSAHSVPIGVFRFIYVILLAFGLFEIGTTLAAATPRFILAIPGEENLIFGNMCYVGALLAAGLFIFSVYLSFEAFEDRRGPFHNAKMPKQRSYRLIELCLRIFLIALLTIKVVRPSNDVNAVYFLAVIALCLFVWSLIVKTKYSAALTHSDILGTLLLVVITLVFSAFSAFSARPDIASKYGLVGFSIMLILSALLLGVGIYLLNRIGRELFVELGKSVRRLFCENTA